MQGYYQYKPKKDCMHRMLWDTDFCCCKVCGQKWIWTEKGWRAVPDHWQDGMSLDQTEAKPEDPYQKFRRAGRGGRPTGPNLKPPKRNMRKAR